MHNRINQDKMKSKLLSAGVTILRTVLLVGFSYIILHKPRNIRLGDLDSCNISMNTHPVLHKPTL